MNTNVRLLQYHASGRDLHVSKTSVPVTQESLPCHRQCSSHQKPPPPGPSTNTMRNRKRQHISSWMWQCLKCMAILIYCLGASFLPKCHSKTVFSLKSLPRCWGPNAGICNILEIDFQQHITAFNHVWVCDSILLALMRQKEAFNSTHALLILI